MTNSIEDHFPTRIRSQGVTLRRVTNINKHSNEDLNKKSLSEAYILRPLLQTGYLKHVTNVIAIDDTESLLVEAESILVFPFLLLHKFHDNSSYLLTKYALQVCFPLLGSS